MSRQRRGLQVVKSRVGHRGRLTQVIHRAVSGVEAPVDVLIVTPQDIEQYRDKMELIIRTALREGARQLAAVARERDRATLVEVRVSGSRKDFATDADQMSSYEVVRP